LVDPHEPIVQDIVVQHTDCIETLNPAMIVVAAIKHRAKIVDRLKKMVSGTVIIVSSLGVHRLDGDQSPDERSV